MRVMNFIFTLYLFLVLLCFVGSFFNVMVVGPTKPKGGGGGGGGGEGAGKGGKPFCCSFPTLVQSWREGGGEGNFWSCGRLNLWKVNLELSFFRGGWCKSSQAFGKLGEVGKS